MEAVNMLFVVKNKFCPVLPTLRGFCPTRFKLR